MSSRKLSCAFPVVLSDSGVAPLDATPDRWEPLAFADPSADDAPAETLVNLLQPRTVTRSPAQASSVIAQSEVVARRYRIEDRIGAGGMGRVYRVRHVELGKQFALKILRSALGDDERARQSFFREARLASALSHPQIISVVDYGEDPKYGLYMVMELVDGEPLKSILHRVGRLTPKQACEVMLQVIEAIRFVHDRGVVHCDIKAENILLCTERTGGRRTQRVKLLDFGLARESADADAAAPAGTPAYLAPERLKGAPPSPSMDIYSLGILFYELLTGGPPFVGTLHEVLACHLNEVPTRPSLIVRGLDERIERVVMKALAKEPAARPENAASMLYELRTAMSELRWLAPERARAARLPNDDWPALGFTECPLPLAVLSPDGTILAGNRAFSVFVSGSETDLDGRAVLGTALARIYPGIAVEIRQVHEQAAPRKLAFSAELHDGASIPMIIWLMPAASDAPVVHCAIHVLG